MAVMTVITHLAVLSMVVFLGSQWIEWLRLLLNSQIQLSVLVSMSPGQHMEKDSIILACVVEA